MTTSTAQAAVVALSLSAGGLSATSIDLTTLPDAVLETLLEADGVGSLEAPVRVRLLRLLHDHPSARVRAAVAQRCVTEPSDLQAFDDVEDLLGALVRDDDARVRETVVAGLGPLLSRQDGLERLRFVAEWTLAPERDRRLAVARAFAEAAPLVPRTALAVLADDDDAEVRAAASRALASAAPGEGSRG